MLIQADGLVRAGRFGRLDKDGGWVAPLSYRGGEESTGRLSIVVKKGLINLKAWTRVQA